MTSIPIPSTPPTAASSASDLFCDRYSSGYINLCDDEYIGQSISIKILHLDNNDCDHLDEVIANCDKLDNEVEIMPIEEIDIAKLIVIIRGQQVLIDRDLAMLYGVETKVLNQKVKRNIARFPERYRFQLTKDEMQELVTNCDRFKSLKHSTSPSYAFTEQGLSMLSAVLPSQKAVDTSIRIMDAFVGMRRYLSSNAHIFQRLDHLEIQQLENKQVDGAD